MRRMVETHRVMQRALENWGRAKPSALASTAAYGFQHMGEFLKSLAEKYAPQGRETTSEDVANHPYLRIAKVLIEHGKALEDLNRQFVAEINEAMYPIPKLTDEPSPTDDKLHSQ